MPSATPPLPTPHPRHRRVPWRALAAVLMGLLAPLVAGCTGTREVRPPVLLVVGQGSGDAATALLLEDTFASAASGAETEAEIRALDWSVEPLPGTPVAAAVTRAGGERDRVWFLTREAGDAQQGSSFLVPFTIEAIDLDAEAGFEEVPGRLRLDGPDGAPGLLDAAEGQRRYCPAELGVSEDGRYLAVFEDRTRCGLDDFEAIYVIDTDSGDLAWDPIITAEGAGIAVDQVENTLLHLDFTGVVVTDLTTGTVRATLDAPSGTTAADDLALTERAALVLQDDAFEVVPLDGEGEPFATETVDGGLRFVPDPTGAPRTVVLSATRYAFHESLDDADFEEGTNGSSGAEPPPATLEPVDGFAYFLTEGVVYTLDLLRGGVSRQTLDALANPGVATWARATAVPRR